MECENCKVGFVNLYWNLQIWRKIAIKSRCSLWSFVFRWIFFFMEYYATFNNTLSVSIFFSFLYNCTFLNGVDRFSCWYIFCRLKLYSQNQILSYIFLYPIFLFYLFKLIHSFLWIPIKKSNKVSHMHCSFVFIQFVVTFFIKNLKINTISNIIIFCLVYLFTICIIKLFFVSIFCFFSLFAVYR